MILEVKSLEELQSSLEHIRHVIAEEEFDIVGHKTCSIGATLYKDHETIDKTIKRADEAVYSAKSAGRNQVVIYDTSEKSSRA